MKIFGLSISKNLESLLAEVESLKTEQPIRWEIIENFTDARKGLAEVFHEGLTMNPTIRLLKSDIAKYSDGERFSSEGEMLLAHELLHIWCKRRGFPRILVIPTTNNNVSNWFRGEIEDLVEHNIVHREVHNRSYDLNWYKTKYNETFFEWPQEDTPEVRQHILKAFRIAESYLYLDLDKMTVQFLKSRFPNTFATALDIASIIKRYTPETPDSCRRCMIRLIRYLDEVLKPMPPFQIRLGLDLVLSGRQLDSLASMYVSYRKFVSGEVENKVDLVQFYFKPDGFFFCSLAYPQGISKEDLEYIEYEMNNVTVRQLLNSRNIRYSTR